MTRKALVLAATSVLALAVGATTYYVAGTQSSSDSAPGTTQSGSAGSAEVELTQPYIIVFSNNEALATYRGGVAGYSAPARYDAAGSIELDVDGVAATRYVQYLEGQQRAHESQIAQVIGRAPVVLDRLQHALNALVVQLSESEAKRVANMVDVSIVEAYREVALGTDVGPKLIGAEPVWNGTVAGIPRAVQGEGVVVGIIDSGINHDSPSFSVVDSIDGYRHVNPLGTGTFLGSCAPGGVDAGKCNDKLIGGYDFVCGPPGNQCGQPGILEEPGFNDTNTHGSHVASTAAGNRRDAVFRGRTVRIAGVAPRANVIAYDVCYTNTAGQGLCPNVSSVAAIDQAIADGVVDVLNYSIGGGTSPWTDAVSLAFLNAADAGIYVAASGGNSGPGPNTMSHNEPWVGTTAAANSGRADFALLMQVTGPGAVPAALSSIVLSGLSGAVELTASLPDNTPLRISAGIDTTTDGCAAFPAGTFTGAIAVVRRGGCIVIDKVNNARNAGAIAFVLANNQPGTPNVSVTGATIPSFGVLTTVGDALRNFGQANPTTATAGIRYPASPIPNTPDALAGFSSRGPAANFALVKPDITAPGVNILATIAFADPNANDSQAVGLLSGTSMASPHHAGAAALLRSARPNLTVSEMKSAFMTTAVQTVLLEDQVTPANAFAGGAGRIQVDHALRAALVFNETKANYLAANPALAGGNPASLNLASIGQNRCVGTCTFTRTVRNAWSANAIYAVKLNGLPGTVSPTTLFMSPNQTRTVTITINGSALAANSQFNFGSVTFKPSHSGPEQRMPVVIAVPAPMIGLPSSIAAAVAPNSTTQLPFSVSNIGGGFLNFNYVMSGIAPVLLQNPLEFVTGFASTRFSDPSAAGRNARFAADDVVLAAPTQVTQLTADGFTGGGAAVTTATATSVRWSLYPNAGGLPAGNPESAPGAAVWTYSSALNGPGVSQSGNRIILNLAAASTSVMLPAGRYWLIVNTVGTTANRWNHLRSTGSAAGQPGIAVIDVSTTGTGSWVANPAVGLTISLTGTSVCGAPWLTGMTPVSGSLAGGQSISAQATVNSTGLAAGTYGSLLCIDSNDSLRPRAAMPVNLTVNP